MSVEDFEKLRLRFSDAQIEYAKTRNVENADATGWDAVSPEGEGWVMIDGDSGVSKWARLLGPIALDE